MSNVDNPDWLNTTPGGNYKLEDVVSHNVANGAGYSGPITYCGNFGALRFDFAEDALGEVQWNINWFSGDSSGFLEFNSPVFDKNTLNDTFMMQGVLSPYYSVGATNSSGAALNISYSVRGIPVGAFGTLMQPQTLKTLDNFAVNASTNVTVTLDRQIVGHGHFFCHTDSTGLNSAIVERWNGTAWVRHEELTTAGGSVQTDLLIPAHDCQLHLFNNDTSTRHFWVALTGII